MHRSAKVQLLGALGFGIALYALSVEHQMDMPGYEAMCDIGSSFSCTAVFRSPYAHILSHLGIVRSSPGAQRSHREPRALTHNAL